MEEHTTQVSTVGTDAFVGRWNSLISTSNWEKGRIISEWRKSLQDERAHAGEYSDETWSEKVGSVSPQHVGRLRRVYERFGRNYPTYEGLYWSHFHAAIDWDDAEMWLEGAIQNRWSISQMRRQRWESMGAVASEQPKDVEIVTAEVDEDFQDSDLVNSTVPNSIEAVDNLDKRHASDESESATRQTDDSDDLDLHADEAITEQAVRPFASLPTLPDDLADAFDSFKLAILRHKVSEWSDIEPDDVLVVLDSLKALVTAPSSTSPLPN